jgi:hypothetical protein
VLMASRGGSNLVIYVPQAVAMTPSHRYGITMPRRALVLVIGSVQ